jgi:hypothetical protein
MPPFHTFSASRFAPRFQRAKYRKLKSVLAQGKLYLCCSFAYSSLTQTAFAAFGG